MKRNLDRELALKENRTTYNGKPCKNCNSTLKTVCDSSCVECNRNRSRKIQAMKRIDGSNKSTRQKYEKGDAGKACRKRYHSSEKGKANNRKSQLKNKYNMTIEDYNLLLELQNHSCKICSLHINDHSRNLAVDHCHTTGKVRSLLCDNCNVALGLVKEDIKIMHNMIKYMEDYK